jgi:hypothetical protein
VYPLVVLAVAALLALLSRRAAAADPTPTDIKLGNGVSISSVKPLARTTDSSITLSVDPFPRPRLAGFLPYVAIAASNQHQSTDFEWEDVASSSYVGSPLNTAVPANQAFVIGFVDSGSSGDLAAGSSAAKLGIVGPYVTGNPVPLDVAGGTIIGYCTQPIGVFAAGLSAVQPDGTLCLNKVVGHWNVSAIATPPIQCDNGEELTAVIGGPFINRYNFVVRVDTPREVVVSNRRYKGPDVQILDPAASLPTPTRIIGLTFGGLAPVTTSNYYPDFEDLVTPMIPTAFSLSALSIPTGGGFFTNVMMRAGPSSPDNPPIPLHMLVDSGAQTSVISPTMVAALSLPLAPDFTVDICGAAGVVSNAPGYYVDYVKIAAQGGALEFSRAPFVVLDLQSPEGGQLDGILGMNFFWNRNVTMIMPTDGSAALNLSDPLAVPYGDSDVDFDVDADDAEYFFLTLTGPAPTPLRPEALHLDGNADDAVDLRDFAVFQRGFTGPHAFSNPTCTQ